MPKNRMGILAFVLLVCCAAALIGRSLYHHRCNQALFEAVKARDLTAVRIWLDRGGDPDYPVQLDPDGRQPPTPILQVAWSALLEQPTQNTEDILCMLFRHGARRADELQNQLVQSCRSGHPRLVRCLLDLDASPDASAAGTQSPIPEALDYGQGRLANGQNMEIKARSREMVHLLMEHGAHINLRDAVRLGDTALVRKLLDAGADPNAPASVLDSSMLSQGEPTLSLAVMAGAHEVLDLLLAHGARPNVASSTGTTPLKAAIVRGDRYSLRALLAHGADPGRSGSTRLIPPHGAYSPLTAALPTHSELIPDLLAAGADINAWSGAPLRVALIAHRSDLVRELLRYGARANVPRGSASEGGGLQFQYSLLELALRNDPASFDPLLRAGADITPDRGTILVTAATCGQKDLIPRLVALGADVNGVAAEGETVLTEAVVHTPSRVKLLLEHGAKPNVVTRSGRTPLILAVESENLELARLLIAHGADVNALPLRGHSPLHIARNHERADLVALLQKAGATVDR